MQKRINIQVKKLVKNKKNQKVTESSVTLPNAESRASLKPKIIKPEKGVTFQQLYFQMKKNKQNCFINSNGSSSTISYKTSNKSFVTPQNRSHMVIDQIQSENIHKSLDKINVQKKKLDNQEQIQGRKTLKRIIRKKQSQKEKSLQKMKNLTNQVEKCTKHFLKEEIVQNPTQKQQNLNIKNRQGFLKNEFQIILKNLDHTMHTHLRQVQCFLQFNEFIHILKLLEFTSFKNIQNKITDKNINFVDYSPLKPDFYQECQFYTYILKMWRQLSGQTYGGVVKDNLLSFLMIMTGQYKFKQFDFGANNHQRPIKNSYINSNLKLTVNSQQIQDIFSSYFPLRMRRQSQLKNNSNSIKMILQQQNMKKYQVYDAFPQTQDFIKIQTTEPLMVLLRPTHQTCNSKKRQLSQTKDEKYQKSHQFRRYYEQESVSEQLKKKMNQFSPKLIPQCRLSQNQIQMKESQHYLTPEHSKQFCSSQIPTMIQTQSRQFIVQSRKPLLSVDVNLGEGKNEKLIVFEGENAHQVSLRLKQKYKISEQLRQRFQIMLDQHIRNLLFKIQQVSQQLFSDQQLQTSQIKPLKS